MTIAVLGLSATLCSWYVLFKQSQALKCHKCESSQSKLYACLQCVYFACYDKKHIHEHAKVTRHFIGESQFTLMSMDCLILCKANCCCFILFNLAVDLSYGVLYCYRCKDHIYDDDFEEVAAVKAGNFFGS